MSVTVLVSDMQSLTTVNEFCNTLTVYSNFIKQLATTSEVHIHAGARTQNFSFGGAEPEAIYNLCLIFKSCVIKIMS